MTKKIILEFIAGCVFSTLGAGCLGAIYVVFSEITGEGFFSRGAFMLILLLGIPMGILVGISVADRLLSKRWRVNIFGLVAGFILGLFGMVLGFYLLDAIGDAIGNVAFILILLITVLLSLVGYNIRYTFRSSV